MTQNGTYRQSIEWLYEQLGQQESKLARAEAFVVQLRASVTHLREVLELAVFNEAKLTSIEALSAKKANTLNRRAVPTPPAQDELNEDQLSKLLLDYNFDEDASNPQDPKQPESLSKKVAEAAESILNKHQKSQELKSILSRARGSSSPLSRP